MGPSLIFQLFSNCLQKTYIEEASVEVSGSKRSLNKNVQINFPQFMKHLTSILPDITLI